MTKSEIREEYGKLRERINQIDELILTSNDHVKELKKERFILCDRVREVLEARDEDYNPRFNSITLIYREDLDIGKIITEGISGVKV